MCEEIVRLAGIRDYAVNKFPQKSDGDLAILLSESKVEMNAVQIKINTSTQIFESIKEISSLAGNELGDEEILSYFDDYESPAASNRVGCHDGYCIATLPMADKDVCYDK